MDFKLRPKPKVEVPEKTKRLLNDKIMNIIITKLCDMVNCDPKIIDFGEDCWWDKYTWTPKQEQEFVDWLYNYMNKDIKVQHRLFGSVFLSDKVKYEAAKQFGAFYGWRINEQ